MQACIGCGRFTWSEDEMTGIVWDMRQRRWRDRQAMGGQAALNGIGQYSRSATDFENASSTARMSEEAPGFSPNLVPPAVKLAQQVHLCPCEGFDEQSRKNARRVYKQFWKSVMVTRKTGNHALSIKTSSSSASTATSPTHSHHDASDDHYSTMAMPDCQSQPAPLTVSIPNHLPSLQCRKPNLAEILNNTAPPPYTLTSFMAFLSQNHCLENLEFTMDASRYRKHYSKMVSRHPGSPISPLSDECAYVLMLWRRLIDAYIRESGPREVNLPAEVRDNLLSLSDSYVPPHPSSLDSAVAKINELMEESVLVSFLNSVTPHSAHPTVSHDSYAASNISRSSTRSHEDRSVFSRSSHPPVPAHQRASAPSSLTSGFMQSRPFSHARFHSQPTSSGPPPATRVTSGYASGSDALTDDSGSASSPSGMSDPLTPPGTPPVSEYPMTDFHHAYYDQAPSSGTPSPRNSRGEHNGLASATRDSWKRVSSKLWPRKKSGSQLRDDEPGVVEGGLF
ncbi:hypothetical protein yc1106_03791 [Curvularia clavata]|uniref:RGS domain-containing protein n=1 Tax=Curvularia clavata TaxID=95742 RepID=A0A9Q8Z6F5_CURCL|nr:hypothetical protein yc1106_03791 [Curvularia clavata]